MKNNNLSITWYYTIDSTNNEFLRNPDVFDNMAVVAADFQTAGRGQRGNVWQSAEGLNLTFSLFLRFSGAEEALRESSFSPLLASNQFVISEIVTLGIKDFLAIHGIDAKIKWPNDIYVRDKKICGILIENKLKGNYLDYSIVGIGLNVNETDFSASLMNPVSMKILAKKDFDRKECLVELLSCIQSHLGNLVSSSDNLKESYLASLYRFNEEHDYTDCSDGSAFRGKIIGVSEDALLKVQLCDGTIKEFAFKEINYII